MKLSAQILFMVIFLHYSVSLASELEDNNEDADPLHYDYDVSSQTMKKRGKDVNIIQLEECKKNLEAEKNVRVIISDALEDVKLSKEDCLTNLKSLQDEKHQLENVVQEEKIVQEELKGAVNVCESQNQDLKQNTKSLKSEVMELEKELGMWKQRCVLLFTVALGAAIAVLIMYCCIPRAALPQDDVANQQERAIQEGPLHQENVLHQHPAPQEAAEPLLNVPEENQCDDDDHNNREGHQVGSHRHRNVVDPYCQEGANQPIGMAQEVEEIPHSGEMDHPLIRMGQEVEEIPPHNGELNLGDPSGQVGDLPGEIYQTATRNSEDESSLAVQPFDD